jgi:hypothetical protein
MDAPVLSEYARRSPADTVRSACGHLVNATFATRTREHSPVISTTLPLAREACCRSASSGIAVIPELNLKKEEPQRSLKRLVVLAAHERYGYTRKRLFQSGRPIQRKNRENREPRRVEALGVVAVGGDADGTRGATRVQLLRRPDSGGLTSSESCFLHPTAASSASRSNHHAAPCPAHQAASP